MNNRELALSLLEQAGELLESAGKNGLIYRYKIEQGKDIKKCAESKLAESKEEKEKLEKIIKKYRSKQKGRTAKAKLKDVDEYIERIKDMPSTYDQHVKRWESEYDDHKHSSPRDIGYNKRVSRENNDFMKDVMKREIKDEDGFRKAAGVTHRELSDKQRKLHERINEKVKKSQNETISELLIEAALLLNESIFFNKKDKNQKISEITRVIEESDRVRKESEEKQKELEEILNNLNKKKNK